MNKSLVFVFLWVISVSSDAQELFVAFGENRSPYVMDNASKGIEIDIFKAALAYKNHTLKTLPVSNNRLETALESIDDLDAAATVYKRDGDFHYVNNFVFFNNYAVSKNKHNFKFNNFFDLIGLQVVSWQGSYETYQHTIYGIFDKQALKLFKSNYFEHPSQEKQNEMFWLDRAEVILIDKIIFNWYRTKLKDKYNTDEEVVFHPIFPKKNYYSAVFRDKKIAKDFEEGLKHIIKTGQYNRIFVQYNTNPLL